MNLERGETTAMVRDILQTSSLEKALKLLCMVAWVDGVLHEKEVKALQSFADEYKLDLDKIMQEVKEQQSTATAISRMSDLKVEIEHYLQASPKKKIILWLQDLIEKIINADDEVDAEEEIIFKEISGMFTAYLERGEQVPLKYNLLLLPQSKEDELKILAINKKIAKLERSIHGTRLAYVIDSYYSQDLAEKAREEYVKIFNNYVSIEKY